MATNDQLLQALANLMGVNVEDINTHENAPTNAGLPAIINTINTNANNIQ